MKTPKRLQPLFEEGLIDAVVRQLISGKEASVYVVRCGEETRCAKVYKEATHRSFRQAVDYTENRKVKNNARGARRLVARASAGRRPKRHGRAPRSMRCTGWPRPACGSLPFNFLDGVLLMELVTDVHGDAASRLNDVLFTPSQARTHHATLLGEVVRMLVAGVVHGDLSEFNVLLAADGPMIIDLPQAVDAAGNNHASRMLLRDVANLRNFFGRFAPELLGTNYGPEMWDLYLRGDLQVDSVLTGQFDPRLAPVDLGAIMREVDDALAERGPTLAPAARSLRTAKAKLVRVRPAALAQPGQRSASNAYLRPIHAPRGAPMPRNCSATGPNPAVGPKMCPDP
jgi:RIO kinase 1